MIRRSEVYREAARTVARAACGRSAVRLALACWLLAACTDPVFEGDEAGAHDASDEGDAEPDAPSEQETDADTTPDATREEDTGAEPGTSDAASGDMDAGTTRDAAADTAGGDSAADGEEAGSDAVVVDTATGDTGASLAMIQTFKITADEDDCAWYVSNDFDDFREVLHFVPAVHGTSSHTIEVGADGGQARAGLRFRLPLAPGARVLEAKLTLKRMPPEECLPTDTMRVQVYDADDVPAFNGSHYHVKPDAHVGGGLWGISVGGFPCGRVGETITSQDLSILVQHIVDRPGWRSDAYLGFVLFPEFLGDGFAPLGDSFEGEGASLRVIWRDP